MPGVVDCPDGLFELADVPLRYRTRSKYLGIGLAHVVHDQVVGVRADPELIPIECRVVPTLYDHWQMVS